MDLGAVCELVQQFEELIVDWFMNFGELLFAVAYQIKSVLIELF